jgi:hypothetical protein
MSDTRIIERKFRPGSLAAVPPRMLAAIAAVVDESFDKEEADYLTNCSNDPQDNQRAGHPFEYLSQLRRWMEGCTDGLHVDPVVWVQNPVPEPGGYHTMIAARRKTIREVHAEIMTLVGRPEYDAAGNDIGFTTVDGADEYFSIGPPDAGEEWPEGRIVVFPLNGSSEGWYVHVEVQTADGQSRLMILGKGFDGPDAAWTLTRRLASILSVCG